MITVVLEAIWAYVGILPPVILKWYFFIIIFQTPISVKMSLVALVSGGLLRARNNFWPSGSQSVDAIQLYLHMEKGITRMRQYDSFHLILILWCMK